MSFSGPLLFSASLLLLLTLTPRLTATVCACCRLNLLCTLVEEGGDSRVALLVPQLLRLDLLPLLASLLEAWLAQLRDEDAPFEGRSAEAGVEAAACSDVSDIERVAAQQAPQSAEADGAAGKESPAAAAAAAAASADSASPPAVAASVTAASALAALALLAALAAAPGGDSATSASGALAVLACLLQHSVGMVFSFLQPYAALPAFHGMQRL